MKRAAEKIGGEQRSLGSAERDIIALGMAIATLILFVGTGGSVLPMIVRSWFGTGAAPDMLLTNAVLLNIALLIFGWRRYNDLHREVAERRRAEAHASELAAVDPLTGCLNRRSGGPAIDALIAQSTRRQREVAVLMIDLDNFKQINDLNGHKAGDAALIEVAHRIAGLLPDEGVLARFGGDEFVCALPYESHGRDQIDYFAARTIEAFSVPIDDGALRLEVTVSMGIADSAEVRNEAGDEGEGGSGGLSANSETLIHRADIAMYHAKNSGRNRFYWFKPQMESDLRLRNELESGIRRGIPAGEFVPYYEQQIDLDTGELAGFEMLARWNSPQLGLVCPDVFIPIAEEIDLIGELSESLIKQALRDAKEWDPKLTLSVNISPLQLRDPWFAQKLLRLLADGGFPPHRFEIEITESCLHENIDAVRGIITSLKNQGVRIGLDDFGTGYSSLAQLRELPFDRLKIDRSFVNKMSGKNMSDELVGAIVSLGRGLSLPVTAEGIETDAILEKLRDMGDLKGQGYLYGQPEDAATTRERLVALNLLTPGKASAVAEPGPAKPLRQAG